MKSKIIYLLLASILILTSCGQKDDSETSNKTSNELEGEITFWHSFTQGPRKEYIEKKAKAFMKKHPKVYIDIETFACEECHSKSRTGDQAGQVPDISKAMPKVVSFMRGADVL